MFKLENKKIGAYLSDLIDTKYRSKRQFCKDYLVKSGVVINDEEIGKMANRISQIIKGAKSIQTYDLPIFTELLGVSCEQILSAGEHFAPLSRRVTNYSIASSKNPEEWEAFINREDKLILNQDEYCKTVLDYALEFGNYELLKYLTEKKCIWFDSRKDQDYVTNFGAGTSIKRRNPMMIDFDLQKELIDSEDKLRQKLIALAADHNDIAMLEELHARESTQMYYAAHYLSCTLPDFSKSFNERTVRHISRSNEDVLEYFTDEFEIRDSIKYKDGQDRKHKYLFPYYSELLDYLIIDNSDFTEEAIKKAIAHNLSTYSKLRELLLSLKNDDYYSPDYNKSLWNECCQKEILFSENGNIISFRALYSNKTNDGIITNIVHSTKSTKNPKINRLIEELNESYNKIKNIKEHLEEL